MKPRKELLETSGKGEVGVAVDSVRAMVYLPFVGWAAAAWFLVARKDRELKWNSVQALLLTGVWMAGTTVGSLPLMSRVGQMVWVGIFVVQLYLVVKMHKGEKVELPYLGELSDRLVGKRK